MATRVSSGYRIGGVAVSGSLAGITADTTDRTQPVTAYEIARRLFAVHPEYARRLGRDLAQPPEADLIAEPLEVWLREVRPLFEESYVPELNGRVVVLGLALLDQPLGRTLLQSGVLEALVTEMDTYYQQELQSMPAAAAASPNPPPTQEAASSNASGSRNRPITSRPVRKKK